MSRGSPWFWWFAWRPVFASPTHSTTPAKGKVQGGSGGEGGTGMTQKESITTSAVLGSVYWVTGMSGILYPGTLWVDPEFGTGAPQVPIFVASVVVAWAGWALEMRRLGKLKQA